MAVVVIGSLNVDLAVDVDHLPRPGETVSSATALRRTPGGKGLNQAVAAARQGAGVRLVGAVGADDDGRWLVQVLADEGVDTASVGTTDSATGLALITVDGRGENTIVVAPGANATLAATASAAIELAADDVVLAQLEIPLETVTTALTRARHVGATTILNASPVTSPLPDELLAVVDVLVVNQLEHAVTGPGLRTTIVTLGKDGARVHRDGDVTDIAHIPAHAVETVDSTAAGDAFAGTLAAALASGDDLDTALRRAAAAGALTVTRPGAAAALPTRVEVDELLRTRRTYSP